jgi:tRNA threonylcarbamoyladenosine biosynthesis protein TsaB
MSLPEPRLLLIETSGQVGQVGLARAENLLQVRKLDGSRRHARDLAPAVVELLTGAEWKPRDLQGIIVSRGPGSYTGLRVGIMSARALAYGVGCTLLAIDTFAALALQAPAEAELVEVIADAQQERIYRQTFARAAGGAREARGPLTIEPLADWLAQRDRAAWLTGPGLRAYRPRFDDAAILVAESSWDPQLQSLLQLGSARLRAGEKDDIWNLEPLYLRPSAAEEKWQARQS